MIKPRLEELGIKCGRDKLFDLLCRYNLLVNRHKNHLKTTDSRHWMRKYPNLIKTIVPHRPEQIWVADITYIPGNVKRHYLHLITDAYSKQIMGYELSDNLEAKSTVKALKKALANRCYPEANLIHHSDRGLQYCSSTYTDLLKKQGVAISMTENGDPYENAIAERVNGIIKNEFGLNSIDNYNDDVSLLTGQAIELYNNYRPHLSCNLLTPGQMHLQKKVRIKTWKRKSPSKRKMLEEQTTIL